MNIVECLNRFLRDLAKPDFKILKQTIKKTDCTLERLDSYISPPAPPLHYGRNVIFRSDLFEAIVINLPPFTATPIHDHGESVCCVHVVSGSLVNRKYTNPARPSLTREQWHKTGDFIYCNYGEIHSMYNPCPKPLISFHLYTPPLRETKFYSLDETMGAQNGG
ncbi:cysteine dioxygenase [Laceyella putida]|uniref:Cysteine dioxygenase n=1 Tax=Laceyella putida TaxID=110101 RepID=A0ABW2RLV1_9BACL